MVQESQHRSSESILNDRMVKGPKGTTTDTVLTCTNNSPKVLAVPTDVSAIHIFNDTSATFRYGGASVTTGTGGKLFPQSTMVMNSPFSDFELFFIQNSGGDLDLDIVNFF